MEINDHLSGLSYSQSRSQYLLTESVSNSIINNNILINHNNHNNIFNINQINNNQKNSNHHNNNNNIMNNSYNQQDSNQNGYFQEIPIPINEHEYDGANIKPIYSTNSYQNNNNFVQPYYQQDKIFVINSMSNPVAVSKYNKLNQLTENLHFLFKIYFIPMAATFFTVLLPLSRPIPGFLPGWEYSIMYIPVVTVLISMMVIGWAKVFIKGIKNWLLALAINTILTSLLYSFISQYSNNYPPPIVIGVSFGMTAVVLPILLYILSPLRFEMSFFKDFLHFMIFVVLLIMGQFLCVTFVIFFSLIEAQTLVMILFFFKGFMLTQAMLWVTRKYCPSNQHNIITFWCESLTEMTICWLYSRFTKINFLILLVIRIITSTRYIFFLSDKYWNYRNIIKEHYDRTRSNSWFSSENIFEKPFYTLLGQIVPISMERNEHMTRIVDRAFYTFLSYCSVPLIYMLFATCLRFSNNFKYYPFDISLEAFILIMIYGLLSSFICYMMFLFVRYLFQVKYDISILNHPIQLFRKNLTLLTWINLNSFIVPITLVLMHNNVFYLVNSGESLYYN